MVKRTCKKRWDPVCLVAEVCFVTLTDVLLLNSYVPNCDIDSLLQRSAAIWRRTVSANVVKLLTTKTLDNAGALATLFNSP